MQLDLLRTKLTKFHIDYHNYSDVSKILCMCVGSFEKAHQGKLCEHMQLL
jgi:hypothetical protein